MVLSDETIVRPTSRRPLHQPHPAPLHDHARLLREGSDLPAKCWIY